MRTNSIDLAKLSPQAAAVFARADKFRTTTLEPEASTWEFVDRHVNTEALREAARLGLTGIEVDKSVGGLGLGFREKVRIAEILSQSSMGFAFSLINTQNVTADLDRLGTDEHRSDLLPSLLSGRRFGATALTEPHAGSDFAAIKTSAAPISGGWLLNGQKAWITNGAIADVVLCYAQTDPDEGRDGIACFLVDGQRDGFVADSPYSLTGGSGIGVGGFTLEDFEVDDADLLIEPGEGFKAALELLNGARVYVAAMACSMIRSALAEAVDYAGSRETFGKTLLDHQGLNWSLADVANKLEAAEALTAVSVDAVSQRIEGTGIDARNVGLAAAHAKRFAVEILEPSLRTCMQAMGANGLRTNNKAGRLLTEARVAAYVDGTTEMQTELIGKALAADYGSESLASASVAFRAVTRSDHDDHDHLSTEHAVPEAGEADHEDLSDDMLVADVDVSDVDQEETPVEDVVIESSDIRESTHVDADVDLDAEHDGDEVVGDPIGPDDLTAPLEIDDESMRAFGGGAVAHADSDELPTDLSDSEFDAEFDSELDAVSDADEPVTAAEVDHDDDRVEADETGVTDPPAVVAMAAGVSALGLLAKHGLGGITSPDAVGSADSGLNDGVEDGADDGADDLDGEVENDSGDQLAQGLEDGDVPDDDATDGSASIFDIGGDGFDHPEDLATFEPSVSATQLTEELEDHGVDGSGDEESDNQLPAASITAVLPKPEATPPDPVAVPTVPPMPPPSSALEAPDDMPGLGEVTQDLPADIQRIALLDESAENDDSLVGFADTSTVMGDEAMPTADNFETPTRLTPPMPPPSMGTAETQEVGGLFGADSELRPAETVVSAPPLPPPSMMTSSANPSVSSPSTPPSGGPPLPGEEHRLDSDEEVEGDDVDDDQPAMAPPLPPEFMRRNP